MDAFERRWNILKLLLPGPMYRTEVLERLRVLEGAPDGSRLVAIKECIPLRAVRRILSYGGPARVVEPDFVVKEVQATITRMASELEA